MSKKSNKVIGKSVTIHDVAKKASLIDRANKAAATRQANKEANTLMEIQELSELSGMTGGQKAVWTKRHGGKTVADRIAELTAKHGPAATVSVAPAPAPASVAPVTSGQSVPCPVGRSPERHAALLAAGAKAAETKRAKAAAMGMATYRKTATPEQRLSDFLNKTGEWTVAPAPAPVSVAPVSVAPVTEDKVSLMRRLLGDMAKLLSIG
jgi:hypothetical protein